jgi:hypothetical protein
MASGYGEEVGNGGGPAAVMVRPAAEARRGGRQAAVSGRTAR